MEWLKNKKNFLVFLGAPGVGKTYFCSAILAWVWGKCPSQRFWDERRLFDRLFLAMEKGESTSSSLNLILDDYFMIYDDIGSQGANEWRANMLFNIVDNRYCSELPTVFTSNLKSEEILQKYGERTWDRLFDKKNLLIDMHGYASRRQQDV